MYFSQSPFSYLHSSTHSAIHNILNLNLKTNLHLSVIHHPPVNHQNGTQANYYRPIQSSQPKSARPFHNKRCHPRRPPHIRATIPPRQNRRSAEHGANITKFREVQEAYELLSDEKRRAEYDKRFPKPASCAYTCTKCVICYVTNDGFRIALNECVSFRWIPTANEWWTVL